MFSKFSNDQTIKRRKLDMIIAVCVALLTAVGFMIVISAVNGLSYGAAVIRTQYIALPVAVGAFIFGWLFNYQIYNEQYKSLYGFIIALLAAVLIFGVVQRGSNSWFKLGIISIQPAEICRIATILVASAFLVRNYQSIKELRILIWFGALLLPIYALIMLQPDFSSIVVTSPALLVLLFAAGVNIFYFILLFLFVAVAGVFPIIWTFIVLNPSLVDSSFLLQILGRLSTSWAYMAGFCALIIFCSWSLQKILKQFRINLPLILFFLMAAAVIAGFFSGLFVDKQMKPYQRKRVEAFLAPQSDPKGASYNVLQAQIAMGSGGVLGKGFFSGTQSRLGFVPERHTDFILAVLGEETGLMGTLGVLGLYILLLWRTLFIATRSSDLYGYMVCCGIFGIFLTYMLVNFGMLIGIMPVAGIPLPFISYGGSNLVASMWAFGIVESVYRRRLTIS